MAIRYPGTTFKQYGKATVVDTGTKTLKAMSEANKLGAARKAQKAKEAAAKKKAYDDMWKGVDKEGIRPADLPDINKSVQNAENFYRTNSAALMNGDPNAHAQLNSLLRKAEDDALRSKVAHKEDVKYHGLLSTDPDSYSDEERATMRERFSTPMSASAWGETEAEFDADGGLITPYKPGYGNYTPQKIFDFASHIDKFKPTEQAFESVRKSGVGNEAIQGYITEYGVKATTAGGVASNNYDQIKLNRSALSQIREKESNPSFMGGMDALFKMEYDKAKEANDRHGQQRAIYGQMLLNGSEGKEVHQLITPWQPSGVETPSGTSYFTPSAKTQPGYLYAPFTSNMQGTIGGQGISINMTSASAQDKQQWAQTYFNQTWEEFRDMTGLSQEAGLDVISTRPGKVIGIQPASGDDVASSKLTMSSAVYYKTKITEKDDKVDPSGVRKGSVSMTVSDIRSMDVWQEDTRFAIMPDGIFVMNPTEEEIEKGVYIDAKKGGIVPSWIINSNITSESTRPFWKVAPVLTGVDKDDNEIYVPIPVDAQGKVDKESGEFAATMAWYKAVVEKSSKGRKGFDAQNEYDLFEKEITGLTGTVR